MKKIIDPLIIPVANINKRNIIVIGGGVIGITTSYYLSKYGYNVICLEKANTLATGASYKNGGLICPSLTTPWSNNNIWKQIFNKKILSSKIAPIKFTSNCLNTNFFNYFPRFLLNTTYANTKRNTITLKNIGSYSSLCFKNIIRDNVELDFGTTSKGTIQLFNNITNNITMNDHSYRGLRIKSLIELETSLTNSSALSNINDWTLNCSDTNGDVHEFTKQLANIIVDKYNVKILTNSNVTGFKMSSEKSNTIKSVVTSDNIEYMADEFVVCSGVDSPKQLEQFNKLCIPIYPIKGYVVSAIISKPLNYNIVDDFNKLFMTCIGKENLRLSGFAIFDAQNLSIDRKYPDHLLSLAKKWLPNTNFSNVSYHICHRPVTPDDVPMIGNFNEYNNLWINTGHGSKGWTQSCGTSNLLANLIIEKYFDCPSQLYDPCILDIIKYIDPNRFESIFWK